MWLLIAYLNNQKGKLIRSKGNLGHEYPHLVAKNPKDELLYIWVKTEIYPTISSIVSIENQEEVINLSNQFNAIPVFAGIRLSCGPNNEKNIPVYGAGYIAEFSGLKAFWIETKVYES